MKNIYTSEFKKEWNKIENPEDQESDTNVDMQNVGEVEYSSDYAINNDKYGAVSVTLITYHVNVDIYKI